VTAQNPDGRQMQMNLTGFLNAKNARTFIQELWELLLSAQENIGGIPAVFLEQKKEEIKMRQVKTFSSSVNICSCLCRYLCFITFHVDSRHNEFVNSFPMLHQHIRGHLRLSEFEVVDSVAEGLRCAYQGTEVSR